MDPTSEIDQFDHNQDEAKDIKPTFVPNNSDLDRQGEDILQDTKEKTSALGKFLEIAKKAKEPEIALTAAACVIGLASAIADVPLGAEVALATGGAAIGIGRGETVTQKIKGAVAGAASGAALSQGITHAHIPGGDYVKAGMNIADDGIVVGMAGSRAAIEAVKNLRDKNSDQDNNSTT